MNQTQTYFREGASGEMSSIAVQTQGKTPLLGSKSFLGEEYSLSKPTQFGWKVSDRFSSSEGWNYFKPQELYVEHKRPRWSVAVGAKQMDALQTDKTWSNPIWFSRYREDKLNNTEVIGPVGLHNHFELGSGWSVSSVLIAAHIPDFGPHQTIQDGQFISRNPWFRPPTREILTDLSDDPLPTHYSVKVPPTEKVVGKPGAILQVDKKLSTTQNLRLLGARKALPSLHLSFPVVYRQFDSSEYLDLGIVPEAVEHTAAAVEWTYQNNPEDIDNTKGAFVSFQYERPDVPARDSIWISQTFKEAYVASAGYRQVVAAGSTPLGLELSYWQVFGGDDRDSGRFAPALSVFERRYDFVQAVKLGASVRKGKLNTSSALIYDYAQQGMLWTNRLNYNFDRQWAMGAVLDVMGLIGPKGRVEDGLLSLYRSNDRFGLGVSYVF